MKRIYLKVSFCLMLSLFTYQSANAFVGKWLKLGSCQAKIVDTGDQGEGCRIGEGTAGWAIRLYYFDGFGQIWGLSYDYDANGDFLVTHNWTDTLGNVWPAKMSGHGEWCSWEDWATVPVPDAEGITIRRYFKHQPPTITVDGSRLDEPFPYDVADEVNPDKIPGTADAMVESWFNTDMGITVHQRALAFSQKYHDDYIIFDWTFKNTGNVDLDPEIELPDQVIDSLYYARLLRLGSSAFASDEKSWHSSYGECKTDTLRIIYQYPNRTEEAEYDIFGDTDFETGFIHVPTFLGEGIVFASADVNDMTTDDPSQPRMTSVDDADLRCFGGEDLSPDAQMMMWKIATSGLKWFHGTPEITENTYPGTHHSVRFDGDELDYKYTSDPEWFGWAPADVYASGPYTLAPGDSVRIVWANVWGSISPEIAWEKGKAWKDETCIWPPWEEGEPNDLADYYPAWGRYPELAETSNDQAKDRWVMCGKDSLFANAWAAQWAIQHDYNVPEPPPAPSIDVESSADKIVINWGNESEVATGFAGYRVYRATGSPYYSEEEGVVVGKWQQIFECGGTATHSYEDPTAERGVAYYYYVAAFDDGSENNGLHPGESLESGKYLNMTVLKPASLKRPAKTLSTVRVVPNPYNISAPKLQYPGEPDKIMFLDLPPVCTIKIYSESGDLVQTIEHTDGSGDEAWETPTGRQFMTSSTSQIVVSGLYIAHIVTPDGMSTNVKFFIVR